MKIALAQLNYTIGDIEGNKSKIIGAVERAKSKGADLVVFAEQASAERPPWICCAKRRLSNFARRRWTRSLRIAAVSRPSWVFPC